MKSKDCLADKQVKTNQIELKFIPRCLKSTGLLNTIWDTQYEQDTALLNHLQVSAPKPIFLYILIHFYVIHLDPINALVVNKRKVFNI